LNEAIELDDHLVEHSPMSFLLHFSINIWVAFEEVLNLLTSFFALEMTLTKVGTDPVKLDNEFDLNLSNIAMTSCSIWLMHGFLQSSSRSSADELELV
jgi:hypothetical protein